MLCESYTKGDCDENAIAVTYAMFITSTIQGKKTKNLKIKKDPNGALWSVVFGKRLYFR